MVPPFNESVMAEKGDNSNKTPPELELDATMRKATIAAEGQSSIALAVIGGGGGGIVNSSASSSGSPILQQNQPSIQIIRSRKASASSINTSRSRSSSVQHAMSDPRLSQSLADLAARDRGLTGIIGENGSSNQHLKTSSSNGSLSNQAGNLGNASIARSLFEKRVKRFFFQITVGCGDSSCSFQLCASNSNAPKFSTEVAAVMAVQLATSTTNSNSNNITGSNSKGRSMFCPRLPLELPTSNYMENGMSGGAGGKRGRANASNTFVVMSPYGGATSPLSSTSPSSSRAHSRQGSTTIHPNSSLGIPAASKSLNNLTSTTNTTSLSNMKSSTSSSSLAAANESIARRKIAAALDTVVPKPFLNSLFSHSSLSSMFIGGTNAGVPSHLKSGGEGSGRIRSASHSLNPLHPSRTSSDFKNVNNSALAVTAVPSEGGFKKSKSYLDLPSPALAFNAPVALMDDEYDDTDTLMMNSQLQHHQKLQEELAQKKIEIPEDEFSEQLEEQIGLNVLNLNLLKIAVEPYIASLKESQPSTLPPPFSSSGSGLGEEEISNPEEIAVSTESLNGDYTFLSNTIHGVFSNIESLGNSFLFPCLSENADGNVPVGIIDIPSIVESYEIILGLHPKLFFRKKLVHAIDLILAKLYINVKQNQNPDLPILRILIILSLNPLCHETQYHESMLKKLCSVFGKIRSKSNALLIPIFAKLDPARFKSVVWIFKKYILASGPPTGNIDESFIGAIKVLSTLSTANEYHHTPIVAISEFYISDVGFRLNFKEEYRKWRKSLEPGHSTELALFNFPFLFDPVAKTRILHIDAMVKMSLEYEDAYVNQALVLHAQRFLEASDALTNMEKGLQASVNPFLILEIRRANLVVDVLDQISRKGADLKKPLKVKFVGGGEEGMDQGGVQKEFFQVLISDLLDPNYGMFEYDPETRYSWISRMSLERNSQYELVGIVLGLALYNGVIVRINFPPIMYKKLLKEQVGLEDIEIAFPALGKGLRQLLDWTDGDVSDVFMRTFEISYDSFGKVEHIPLMEGGHDILVTNANRREYVKLYIKHFTDSSVSSRFKAFQQGFYKVCGGRALALCRPSELELLICGRTTDDQEFLKLEEGAGYDDGFSPSHSVIKWFWEIVHSMDLLHKRKLLEFVTASDRVPLKGLNSLVFVIQRNGPDTDRLPSALTCFGRLLLPEYSTKEKLKERLTTAIENAKGFGLV